MNVDCRSLHIAQGYEQLPKLKLRTTMLTIRSLQHNVPALRAMLRIIIITFSCIRTYKYATSNI